MSSYELLRSIRILGSTTTNSTSDITVPNRVNMVRKSRIDPARYVSCVISALSIIGPAVGRPNTMAVIAPPDIRCGNNQARLLIKGFRQILTGYLNNTFELDRPLLRAVTTYCFSSSSRSVARSTRMRPAEPPVATTNTGIGKCLSLIHISEPTRPY